MRKTAAFLKKEFLVETSYRFAFLWDWISILFPVVIFYFLSRLVGGPGSGFISEQGTDYFSFVIIGLAFSNYLGVGLSSFSGNLRREQVTGTLESVFSTPTRPSVILMSLSAWNFLYASVQVAIFLLLGKFLGVDFSNADWGSAIIVFILTMISLSGIGIISAGFVMIFKRGDPVSWIIGNLFDVLGGVFFPVALLPEFLRQISSILPISHSLRGLRLSLFRGYDLAMLSGDLMFLVVFCIIIFPASLLFFGYAVKKAKENASLNQY